MKKVNVLLALASVMLSLCVSCQKEEKEDPHHLAIFCPVQTQWVHHNDAQCTKGIVSPGECYYYITSGSCFPEVCINFWDKSESQNKTHFELGDDEIDRFDYIDMTGMTRPIAASVDITRNDNGVLEGKFSGTFVRDRYWFGVTPSDEIDTIVIEEGNFEIAYETCEVILPE
ncbi:MAG: hypothetical protein MJZ77_06755 [Bacteroidales bacterium]|nr:hypothetical protein [Bacteroidales bacterium]